MGLNARKPVLGVWEQQRRRPACAEGIRSLISTFVISFLESIISNLATGKISFSSLISVAEETGLSLTLLETLKTGFVALRPICLSIRMGIFYLEDLKVLRRSPDPFNMSK